MPYSKPMVHAVSSRIVLALVVTGSLALVGCASDAGAKKTSSTTAASTAPDASTTSTGTQAPTASATLEARSGSQVSGMVDFFALGDNKTRVVVHVSGLAPGPHGIHLHEKGDCSAPDAASAGGHWNPTGVNHGGPNSPAHHAGDFGNLEAGADGKATLTFESSSFALNGDTSVIGHAVVVHEKVDDFVTQPSGNSGNRVGCGVIQKR